MNKFAALQAFAAVVEKGSFAAASREGMLSRSQINKLVFQLEDDLGVQLLNRTTRSVSLTPAGDTFYNRSRAILNELKDAELSVQTEQVEPQGQIRLNAPQSFGIRHLAPALIKFMSLYPKIAVQLNLSDQFIDPVSDGYDITLRIAERKDNPSLIMHEIIETRRVLCASPAFLHEHGIPQSPQLLSEFSCLHYGNLPTGNFWRLQKDEEVVDVRVNGRLCANNADVLNDAAVAGLGIAMLPVFIAQQDLRAGRLVTILDDFRPPDICLTLVYPPSRHLSTRIRLFVKFIQEWFELSDF